MSSISSATGSTYGSGNRITGLYSGFDTDTMVEQLVANSTHQKKIDKTDKKVTNYEWENEALESVMDMVEEFQNKYLSSTSETSMLSSVVYRSFSVEALSDSKAVKVEAGTTAFTGSVSVAVVQLAVNAKVSSSGKVSADGKGISESNTTKLGDLAFANKLRFNYKDEISFSINGEEFTFSKDTTLQSMINTINSSEEAGVTMKYSRLTDSFTIEADSGGADSEVAIRNISGNAFGADSAFGIAVGTYNEGTQDAIAYIDGVRVVSESNTYSVDGLTYTFNDVTATENVTKTYEDVYTKAADGEYIKNGDAYEKLADMQKYSLDADGNYVEDEAGTYVQLADGSFAESATLELYNKETIEHVSYDGLAEGSETLKFNVEQDYSKTADAIEGFIEDYNTLVESLTSLVKATNYQKTYNKSVFEPLTDAQKEEMTEEEIEKWEEKAKSGILSKNDDIEKFLSDLRSIFFNSAGDTGKNLTSIGITSGSYYTDDRGKIVVDRNALEAALAANPEEVVSMFTNYSADASERSSEAGIMYKFRSTVNEYLDVAEEEIEKNETRIDEANEKVSELQDKLSRYAERMYDKFAAMEQALAKLNNQAGYIAQLLNM